MKSEWRVTSNSVCGEKIFATYRLRDINEVDHSGNREYAGGWVNEREKAQEVADQLNAEGGNWWILLIMMQ